MLEQRFCPVCNSEIVFDYVHPVKSFRINYNGEINRDDNNLDDNPSVEFYCSEDREHDIGDDQQLMEWCDQVEMEFKDRGSYAL